VAPSSLAEIKKVIRSVTYQEARAAVDEALLASTPDELAMGVTERLSRMIDLGKFNGGHSLSGA
jgi:phosphotransferase system enzyme I (PtsI)